MMMSGGLVFSQIPLQFLSQICQQNIHRLTDDSLGSDSRDQQPKLTLFFISPSEGKTPEAEDENIFFLISVQFTEDCHFHVIVPNSHFRQCVPVYKSQSQRNLKEPLAPDFVVSSSANLFPAEIFL